MDGTPQLGVAGTLDLPGAGAEATVEGMAALGVRARRAARRLALASADEKNAALNAMAEQIRTRAPQILAANAEDVSQAMAKGQSPAFVDRLGLDLGRLEAVAS